MNAQEARKIAEEHIKEEYLGQYTLVKATIKKAVNRGDFECYYYNFLKKEVIEKLTDEGYKIISDFNQKDGASITISW